MKKPTDTNLRRTASRQKFVSVEEPFPSEAGAAFEMLVKNFAFPCVSSTPTSNWGAVSFGFYDKLGCDASTKILARDLERFALTSAMQPKDQFANMLAVFRGPFELNETEFDKLLCSQLEKLRAQEKPNLQRSSRARLHSNESVFPFNFAGCAYSVIGMHANSSHRARQFPWPTLVFNPSEQFQALRANAAWEQPVQTISAGNRSLRNRAQGHHVAR